MRSGNREGKGEELGGKKRKKLQPGCKINTKKNTAHFYKKTIYVNTHTFTYTYMHVIIINVKRGHEFEGE